MRVDRDRFDYVVVGAGAIGGTVGARLVHDGHSVLFSEADAGVRVNCVGPGSIRTPMLLDNLAAGGDVEAGRARAAARHPLGRVGEAEEVADAIAFLLGEQSSFVTAAPLTVDDGLTAI